MQIIVLKDFILTLLYLQFVSMTHFKYILAQDIYKNALTAEQLTEVESYLPENYQNDYID